MTAPPTTTALTRRPDEVVLITGLAGIVGERLVRHLLETSPRSRLFVLVEELQLPAARSLYDSLPVARQRRLEVLTGNVRDIDLGLAGQEFRRLSQSVTLIHHVAEATVLDRRGAAWERVNVDGTRGVVELAYECSHLARLVHWSTILVAGQRQGVVMEDELDLGQPFHNGYEESKLRGEKIVLAAARRLPVTILRPGLMALEARSGAVDESQPVGQLVAGLARAARVGAPPKWSQLDHPLHVVPIDHVVEAASYLAQHPDANGMTFHLTDPSTISLHRLASTLRGRALRTVAQELPRGGARAVAQGLPISTLARSATSALTNRSLKGLLEWACRPVYFNARNAMRLLRTTDFVCPSVEQYADRVLRQLAAQPTSTRGNAGEHDTFDPLD